MQEDAKIQHQNSTKTAYSNFKDWLKAFRAKRMFGDTSMTNRHPSVIKCIVASFHNGDKCIRYEN